MFHLSGGLEDDGPGQCFSNVFNDIFLEPKNFLFLKFPLIEHIRSELTLVLGPLNVITLIM